MVFVEIVKWNPHGNFWNKLLLLAWQSTFDETNIDGRRPVLVSLPREATSAGNYFLSVCTLGPIKPKRQTDRWRYVGQNPLYDSDPTKRKQNGEYGLMEETCVGSWVMNADRSRTTPWVEGGLKSIREIRKKTRIWKKLVRKMRKSFKREKKGKQEEEEYIKEQ